MPYFPTREGASLFYEERGEGIPIILLHSVGLHHLNWANVVPRLCTTMRTIAVDIRGHGRSPAGGSYHFAQLADDLADLLIHINCPQAYVAGYSATTSILFELIRRYPTVVRGFIGAGAYASVQEWRLRNKIRSVIYLVRLGFTSLMTTGVAMSNAINFAQFRQFKEGARNTVPRVVLSILREGLAYDATPWLQSVNVPMLLVYGDRDGNMSLYGHHIKKHVPSAELSIIKGVGHTIPTHANEAFSRYIGDFVARIEK